MVSPILIGPLNFHFTAASGPVDLGGDHPIEEALLDGQAEEPVGDALAELRGLHVLGVGVQHVVVAAEPREDHDVGLGHGAAGRGVLLADRDVLEVDGRLSAHGPLG